MDTAKLSNDDFITSKIYRLHYNIKYDFMVPDIEAGVEAEDDVDELDGVDIDGDGGDIGVTLHLPNALLPLGRSYSGAILTNDTNLHSDPSFVKPEMLFPFLRLFQIISFLSCFYRD